jgi:hypothetical protein
LNRKPDGYEAIRFSVSDARGYDGSMDGSSIEKGFNIYSDDACTCFPVVLPVDRGTWPGECRIDDKPLEPLTSVIFVGESSEEEALSICSSHRIT